MNKALLAAICLVLIATSIGCNTIRGLGEDVKTVGGWVTKGVDNVQEK
jgi:predicted small secreted protein